MADNDLTVLIRAVLDSKGFDDLQVKLRQVQGDGKSAGAGANEFNDALKNLSTEALKATGLVIGIAEAFHFIKESVQEALAQSRLIYQFDEANARLGASTEEARERTHEWLTAVEQASGIIDHELIPAYGKLSEITTTTAAAQGLLQIAAGASARGLGDVNTIAQTLARSLSSPDGAVRATGEFGLLIKNLRNEGKSTEEILKVLVARFGDAGANVHNAGIDFARMRVENQHAKEGLGETAASLLTVFAPALRVGAIAVATVEAGLIKLYGWILNAANSFKGLFTVWEALVTGGWSKAKEAFQKVNTEGEAILKQYGDKATEVIDHVMSAFQRSDEARRQNNEKMVADILAGLTTIKGSQDDLIKQYDLLLEKAKHAGQGEADSLLMVSRIYAQMAADRRLDENARQKAANQQIETLQKIGKLTAEEVEYEIREQKKLQGEIKKSNDDWLAGETAKLAASRKAADNEFKLQDATLKAMSHSDLEYARKRIELMKQTLAAHRVSADEELRITRELAVAEVEVKRKQAELEREVSIMLADDALNLMGAAFGKTKAYAIAQAIIDTYKAATKAWGWEPAGWWNAAAVAMVVAAGLANVATIASTEPGGGSTGGFDNPDNDFAAVVGGRKWARDMVDHFAAGAALGFSQGMMRQGGGSSSSAVYNNQRTMNQHTTVNFAGPYLDSGDDVAMRKIAKKILYAQRLDSRRTAR